ncbi:MAG: hypothetical protein COV67_11680, partial [Nitrospinae bacterium CG11_big_fil_rev_8_21_14_0_20_56_8]
KPPVIKLVRGKAREARLAEPLRFLQEEHGACGIKLSTEDAGMSFDQIRFWTGVCEGILPVMVKIGGPNARNDVKQFVSIPVDGLIAPMVESPYGLENFISAVRDFTTPLQFKRLKKQVNIETQTAVEQLSAILDSPGARFLEEITIGCSDLSKSMGKSPSDPEVQRTVKKAVSIIKNKGFRVSLGGGISPGTIDSLLESACPTHFNTRVVTFQVFPGRSYKPGVEEALRFEMAMLENDLDLGFISREEERHRAQEIQIRLL